MNNKEVEQQTHLRLPAQLGLGLGWVAEELLHLCGTIELRVNLHPAVTELITFHADTTPGSHDIFTVATGTHHVIPKSKLIVCPDIGFFLERRPGPGVNEIFRFKNQK